MDLTNRHLYEMSSDGFIQEFDLIPNTIDLSSLDSIMAYINADKTPAYHVRDSDLEHVFYLHPTNRFVLKVFIRRQVVIPATDLLQRSWRDDNRWLYVRKIMPNTSDWTKITAKYEHLLLGST